MDKFNFSFFKSLFMQNVIQVAQILCTILTFTEVSIIDLSWIIATFYIGTYYGLCGIHIVPYCQIRVRFLS